jgi:hypothetical protein
MLVHPPREGFFRRKSWNLKGISRLAVRRQMYFVRLLVIARSSRARSLKSSSEERIEMRVWETRRSASYRLVTASSPGLWIVPLITVQHRQCK